MLQDSLSKIKYFLVLAVLLVLPVLPTQTMAQPPTLIIDQTDTGVNRLVAFWDTRQRDTLIQVTNTSGSLVGIHVQLFDVNSLFTECEECNFDDELTGFDTHVYNLEDMMTNAIPGVKPSVPVCTEIGPGTYGMAVISRTFGPNFALIGVFRIIDESGYEYRTNLAGEDVNFFTKLADQEVVNFSDANGNNLSDLVGLTYISINSGTVLAGPGITATFGSVADEILIWDEIEVDQSCSPTTFACAVGFMDKGIDNALPNSKGQLNRVCPTAILDSNSAGWLDLPFTGFGCLDPDPNACLPQQPHRFMGYIGLNNGDGTGSMDSWWENF